MKEIKDIYIFTLGCPKNEVDSQIMAKCLTDNGWTIRNSIEESQIIIINTCGFIEEAKGESLDIIWQALDHKEKGQIQHVIVTGCLAERYGALLAEEIPELDAIIGNRNIRRMPEFLASAISSEKKPYIQLHKEFDSNWYEEPIASPNANWSYIKVAEGCNNRCSYCSIPGIRGDLRSIPMESIIKQANHTIENGAKEIIVVAQDTTAYGMENGQSKFADLIYRLTDIQGDFWIRVLYAHPKHLSDENIKALAQSPKVVPYLDLPIQHISDKMLSMMSRKVSSGQIRERIEKIKEKIPNVTLRTSVIVGFPGETDKDFDELAEYIGEGHFVRGGVFSYSQEEGTSAADLPEQVSTRIIQKRKQIMDYLFEDLRHKRNKSLEGNNLPALIENRGTRPELYWGRTIHDAPQIDCMVRIKGEARVGDIMDINIIRGSENHLLGIVK